MVHRDLLDPQLRELARRLRRGRAAMPSQTEEQALAQAERAQKAQERDEIARRGGVLWGPPRASGPLRQGPQVDELPSLEEHGDAALGGGVDLEPPLALLPDDDDHGP